jgi:DNA-binding transcriptional ArsR family regulator
MAHQFKARNLPHLDAVSKGGKAMSQQSAEPASGAAEAPVSVQELPTPSVWRQHDTAHGFPDPLLDLIATRFRLLGEPLRLKLLAILSGGERSVSELVELTSAGQANISKHLAALAEGGLVRRRKAGTSTYYSIADATTLTLCDVVCAGLQERFVEQARAFGWTSNQQGKSQSQQTQSDASLMEEKE